MILYSRQTDELAALTRWDAVGHTESGGWHEVPLTNMTHNVKGALAETCVRVMRLCDGIDANRRHQLPARNVIAAAIIAAGSLEEWESLTGLFQCGRCLRAVKALYGDPPWCGGCNDAVADELGVTFG